MLSRSLSSVFVRRASVHTECQLWVGGPLRAPPRPAAHVCSGGPRAASQSPGKRRRGPAALRRWRVATQRAVAATAARGMRVRLLRAGRRAAGGAGTPAAAVVWGRARVGLAPRLRRLSLIPGLVGTLGSTCRDS